MSNVANGTSHMRLISREDLDEIVRLEAQYAKEYAAATFGLNHPATKDPTPTIKHRAHVITAMRQDAVRTMASALPEVSDAQREALAKMVNPHWLEAIADRYCRIRKSNTWINDLGASSDLDKDDLVKLVGDELGAAYGPLIDASKLKSFFAVNPPKPFSTKPGKKLPKADEKLTPAEILETLVATIGRWCIYGVLGKARQLQQAEIVLRIFDPRATTQSSFFTVDDGVSKMTVTSPMILPAERLASMGLTAPEEEVKAVGTDILQHFPEFEDLLDFIVYARLSSSRKKAYLWLKAPSDFGKSLLFSQTGILGSLYAVFPVLQNDLDADLEGKPSGRKAVQYSGRAALFIDEFSRVSRELKGLTNSITLNEKFGAATEVEVYGKIFASADDVVSLTGIDGIEAQFANRFAVMEISGRGKIDDRKLRKAMGYARYDAALTVWTARRLQQTWDEMLAKQESETNDLARQWIDAFHAKYSLADEDTPTQDDTAMDKALMVQQMVKEFFAWKLARPLDHSKVFSNTPDYRPEGASEPKWWNGLNHQAKQKFMMLTVGVAASTHLVCHIPSPGQFIKSVLGDDASRHKLTLMADTLSDMGTRKRQGSHALRLIRPKYHTFCNGFAIKPNDKHKVLVGAFIEVEAADRPASAFIGVDESMEVGDANE